MSAGMGIDTTIYSLPYIRRREAWSGAYDVLARLFAETFGTGSIIDVGCAGGLLVEALRETGYEAWGLDGAPASESLWPATLRRYYLLADLTRPEEIALPVTDCVCSLEVAEHLPEAHAPGYVALLTRHHPRRVLFTAAPYGQPGDGHLNCRPFSFWIGLFAARGYVLDMPGTCYVRQVLRARAADRSEVVVLPTYYINNFLAFRPGDASDSPRSIEPVRGELTAQRELLDYLNLKMLTTVEMIAMLRRGLGESSEMTIEQVLKLRPFI